MSDGIKIVDQFGRPLSASASDSAHFAASMRAREMSAWLPPLQSATGELDGERDTIAARAYDLERNDGIAGGAMQTYVDNIVGIGLRLSARPDYRALGRTKEWADEWSRTVEAGWRTFAGSPDFDAGRSMDFGAHSAIMLRTALLDGDSLAIGMWLGPERRPGAKWSTCILGIDPARLATPPGKMDGHGIHSGVEVIPETGEPLAYWIRRSHPGDIYLNGYIDTFERVKARTEWGRRRVIHLFDRQRYGQVRGKSVLAKVMSAFKMLSHYQRVELQTVIVNSMIAAFIETPLPPEQIAELFGTTDKLAASRGSWDVRLEGAGIIPLHPGDKLAPFMPTRPNGAFGQFVEAVHRYIATGLNMPYELLMKDFSKTNYSSARAALLEAWRFFMAKREWLGNNWATPVYEMWLEEAIARGEVEDPGYYENRVAVCACKWIGPGRGWVDPVKEADAAKIRMGAGLSTLERECAEQGLDWEEVLEQRAREDARMRELGVTLDGMAPTDAADPYPTDAEDDVDETAELRSRMETYSIGTRSGSLTPQVEDEQYFREAAGLPPPGAAVSKVWQNEPTRRPVTLAQPGDSVPAPQPEESA